MVTLEKRLRYGGEPALVLKWLGLGIVSIEVRELGGEQRERKLLYLKIILMRPKVESNEEESGEMTDL